MSNQISILTASNAERDCAKRLADIVNGLAIAHPVKDLFHVWLAVRLSDGSTDGNMYTSRREAVSNQPDEKLCAYLFMGQATTGMTVNDAYHFLAYYRAAYDAGFRLPDPDNENGGRELIAPVTKSGVHSQISRLLASASRVPGYRG